MSKPSYLRFIVEVPRDKGTRLRLYGKQVEEPELNPWVKVRSPPCSLSLEYNRLMSHAVSVRTTRPGLTFWMLMNGEVGRHRHANYTSGKYHYTSHLSDRQTFQSLNIGSTEGGGRETVSLRNC